FLHRAAWRRFPIGKRRFCSIMLKNMELLIGRVIKSHGIKGEVSVDVTTDSPEERFYPGAVLNGKQGAKDLEFTISTVRAHKGRLLLTFEENTDRTQADSLRGVRFFAPPLEEDDADDGFYDHELEGLNLVLDGNVIGEVTGISHGPVQSLLEAKPHNRKEALIPFVEEIVL